MSKHRGWPAPTEYTYDGDDVEESGTTFVTGVFVFGITNVLYTSITLFGFKVLKDVGLIDFSFTWKQVGIMVTAVQFARIWDRTLMR